MNRVARAPRSVNRRKTPSELLFEDYLKRQDARFEYEAGVAGKRRRLDYRVTCNDHILFCEVKELHGKHPRPAGAAHFDPYGGIRKEIHQARRQFKEYKDYCCVLVIHNVDDWEFRDWPNVLFGAMLGDLGLEIPFDQRRGRALIARARSAFLERGKMIDPTSGRTQNTTISAIAVVSEFTIPNPHFEKEYENRISAITHELGAEPTIDQRLGMRVELYEELPLSLGHCPRVSVFENPFARIHLPDDVLKGKYDARFRYNQKLEKIERIYAGRGLRQVEETRTHDRDILQRIEQFKQAIVEHFAPERIVLFGSHAYGSAEPGSDVDLLVVFPGAGSAAHRSLDIRKRLNHDFPLDLLTLSAGEIARRLKLNDPFVREVLGSGKTLYESTHS